MVMAAVQALVLVDVQAAFVAGQLAVPDAESLTGSVTGLLARARSAGSLVVHLQNDGEVGAVDEPGRPGWELHLRPGPGERVIRKTGDDGFQGTTLGRVLIAHRVSRLAIAGVLSEMCIWVVWWGDRRGDGRGTDPLNGPGACCTRSRLRVRLRGRVLPRCCSSAGRTAPVGVPRDPRCRAGCVRQRWSTR